MALIKSTLKDSLERLFSTPPSSPPELAKAWSDAFFSYVSSITPPANPALLEGGKQVMVGALTAAFVSPATALPAFEAAFVAGAAVVGASMAPAFVGTLALPPNFVILAVPPFPPNYSAAAEKWASHIDTWLKSGTAVQSVSGATVPWL